MGLFYDSYKEVYSDYDYLKIICCNCKDLSYKYHLRIKNKSDVMVYRNGDFLRKFSSFDGNLYPFSKDLTVRGTWFQKYSFKTVKFVIIGKYSRRFDWGWAKPIPLTDPVTDIPYYVGAGGSCTWKIAFDEQGNYADKFLQTIVFPHDLKDVDEVENYLRQMLANILQSKFAEYVAEKGYSLEKYAYDFYFLNQASQDIFPDLQKYFLDYGVELDNISANSLLLHFLLMPCVPT